MPTRANSITTSPSVPLQEYQGMLIGGDPMPTTLLDAVRRGYRLVVDMRAEPEIDPDLRRREVEAMGLGFVHVPVVAACDLEGAAKRLHEILEHEEGPFIVHCKSGNRVGAVFALRAHRHLGCTPSESLEIGRETGLRRLEPEVKQLLGC